MTGRHKLCKSYGMTLAAEPARRTSPNPRRSVSRRPRILVADDDAEFRELLAGALRDDDYDVIEESDGGRLLVRVAASYTPGATPIDLIVSDVCMPVCSGLNILKGLRKANWSTPVILMTAFGDGDLRASAAHLGAVLFEKPFDACALKDKVRELLLTPGTDGCARMAAP
jgi:DNA-binding response OmpR family regulator